MTKIAWSEQAGQRSYIEDKDIRLALSHTIGDQKGMSETGVENRHATTLLGLNDITGANKTIQRIMGDDPVGYDIVLTVNAELSAYAAGLFPKGSKGALAIINYKTGAILAKVSLPAFDPAAGGGALMDINIYNLHFVLALCGRPLSAHYVCRRGFNGVDLSGTAVLEYEGLTALCTGAKDTDAPSFGLLQGDDGWLRIDGSVSTMPAITVCLRGEQPQQIPITPVSHRLAPEFAAFADILSRGDYDTMNRLLDHSLDVLDTKDGMILNDTRRI